MKIEQIAELVHETNRVYCRLIGDNSQPAWINAPAWQRESAITGVTFRLNNREAPASVQHNAWLKDKLADGWKYGPVKDLEEKTHPCCVSYDELPWEQKVKDKLFVAIVNAFSKE